MRGQAEVAEAGEHGGFDRAVEAAGDAAGNREEGAASEVIAEHWRVAVSINRIRGIGLPSAPQLSLFPLPFSNTNQPLTCSL